jgi:hypothetical protein
MGLASFICEIWTRFLADPPRTGKHRQPPSTLEFPERLRSGRHWNQPDHVGTGLDLIYFAENRKRQAKFRTRLQVNVAAEIELNVTKAGCYCNRY